MGAVDSGQKAPALKAGGAKKLPTANIFVIFTALLII
jgi:hypothetical protein